MAEEKMLQLVTQVSGAFHTTLSLAMLVMDASKQRKAPDDCVLGKSSQKQTFSRLEKK